MHIETTQNKLLHALSKVGRVPSKNPTLPVLKCLLLDAKKGVLTIRATNLDVGVSVSLPVRTHEEGVVAVPGSILFSSIGSASAEDVRVVFKSEGGSAELSTARRTATLKTLAHDDFPTLPKMPEGTMHTLRAADLVRGLRSVWYSASPSVIKPELSSVYVAPGDSALFFVASDSFRLAEKRIQLKEPAFFEPFLLPYKNVPEIVRALEDVDENVTVGVNRATFAVNTPSMYLASRVVDGVFPDYTQIMPSEFSATATLLKQDMINALKLTNVFSDSFNRVSIAIDPEGGRFEIATSNPDIGEHKEVIPAALQGEAHTLGFNHRYMFDCFQSIPTDSIILKFGGANKPLIIQGVGDNSFRYLVMPMNR